MFYANHEIDAAGTSLQGNVLCTRNTLVSVFGNPIDYPEGDKVTTEWIIKFDNELVATIYDWKRYDKGRPGQNEEYEWHVGGTVRDVVSLVRDSIHRYKTNVIA